MKVKGSVVFAVSFLSIVAFAFFLAYHPSLKPGNVACAASESSTNNAKFISIPVSTNWRTGPGITSADFDGDGDIDIAVAVASYGTKEIKVYILKNDGKGNFSIISR